MNFFGKNLRYTVLTLLILLLTAEVIESAPPQWQIRNEHLEGADNALIWKAEFFPESYREQSVPYRVSLGYGSAVLVTTNPGANVTKLKSVEISLAEGKKGILTLWREVHSSAAAAASPPLRVVYTFQLTIGRRLHISREHSLWQRGPLEEPPGGLLRLEEDARRLAFALTEPDMTDIENSRLVQLAIQLLTTETPLGTPILKLDLKSCRIGVNDKTVEATFRRDTIGNAVVLVPARKNDTVTLIPEFRLREYTAFSNTVVIKQRPLPSFAFVKMEQRNGTLHEFGRPTAKAGEFKIGPVRVKNLRKMKLLAVYPLEPPGFRPGMKTELLFRTGRSIEAYLDRGVLPPMPSPSRELSPGQVVPLVLRTAGRAVNPDLGEIPGLSYSRLVDLYAIGYNSLNRQGELRELLEDALIKEIARKSWTYPRHELSPGQGWMEQDAIKVLEYPDLVDILILKLLDETEPRHWRTATKSAMSGKKIDRISAAPHALVLAALSRFDGVEYRKPAREQLAHLEKIHERSNLRKWELTDLIKTGQALKFVEAHSRDRKIKREGGHLLAMIRHEALRRFRQNFRDLKLYEKIDIAHVISDVWRPYLNTPKHLLIDTPDIEQISIRHRGARGLLHEDHLRFRSALYRAVHEFRSQDLPAGKKKTEINNLVDRWQQYLARSHQGKLPSDFINSLEKERQMALESVLGE